MNVIQGIWRDLIDKRLWPYALALLVLIVAIPVVLARTGGSPADYTAYLTSEIALWTKVVQESGATAD